MTVPRIILELHGVRVVRWKNECQLHGYPKRRSAHKCEACFVVELKSGTDAMNQPIWRKANENDGYLLASALRRMAIDSEKEIK